MGFILAAAALVLLAITGIGGCMYIAPQYGVWSAELEGKAELAHAEYSKQVAVQTAKAKNEAATYEAEAEVTRAKGVAKANAIIGSSLKDNEAYLRYLWIQNLNGDQGERIYIPTEAGLPILEAGKAKK